MRALTDEEWRGALRIWLKKKLEEKDLALPELAIRLSSMGVDLDRRTLSNKLNRVSFTAAFLFQVMAAMGEDSISLADIASVSQDSGGISS